MQTVRTINESHARAARTLIDHYPSWDHPGICRCGAGYGFDATNTGAQHTGAKLLLVTPKEVTRC